MKQFAILFLGFLIASCSSNDETNPDQTNNLFNPPGWIIGTWTNTTQIAGNTQVLKYIFTANNVKEIVQLNGTEITSIDYTNFYNNNYSEVTEEIKSNFYELKFAVTTNAMTSNSSKKFVLKSNNEIELVTQEISAGVIFTK